MHQRRLRASSSRLCRQALAAALLIAAATLLRADPVKVGMDVADLLAAKGKPVGSLAVAGRTIYEWSDIKVMAQNGKVVKVTFLNGDPDAAKNPVTIEIISPNAAMTADIKKKARADYEASQAKKVIWARHALGEAAPSLAVEKWLTAQPSTAGKFVLIDFWATWCEPCRKAIPVLNDISKEFSDRLTVIGISNQPEAEVAKMTSPSIAYAVAIDTQERMENALKVEGIPHAILIDPQGVIRWEGYPLSPGNELTMDVVKNVMDMYGPDTGPKD